MLQSPPNTHKNAKTVGNRAVGNDHFCDATKRASQRQTCHTKGDTPLSQKWGYTPGSHNPGSETSITPNIPYHKSGVDPTLIGKQASPPKGLRPKGGLLRSKLPGSAPSGSALLVLVLELLRSERSPRWNRSPGGCNGIQSDEPRSERDEHNILDPKYSGPNVQTLQTERNTSIVEWSPAQCRGSNHIRRRVLARVGFFLPGPSWVFSQISEWLATWLSTH